MDVKGDVGVCSTQSVREVGDEEVFEEGGGEGPCFFGVGVLIEVWATEGASRGWGKRGEGVLAFGEGILVRTDAIALPRGMPGIDGGKGGGGGGGG